MPALDPPRAVRRIAERLERAGYETWCVGGAVRDALLGRAHTADWDLATAATPDDVQRLFPRRTVPKGIRFGTVGVLDEHRVMHEVTTFRRDVTTDGRHAVVAYGASLDEDLARRDFTINAIAYSPTRGVLRDPFDGRADLARRLVRSVGDPATRLREDYLRALRALRFATRLGFDIDAATWAAVCASAPALPRLSRERVRDELEKTIAQGVPPSRGLELWRASGALAALVPVLADRPPLVFGTLDVLAAPTGRRADERLANRLAALFVDLPVRETRRTLRELRLPNARLAWIAHLAETWSRIGADVVRAVGGDGTPTDATLRQWVARAGRLSVSAVLRIAIARCAAARGRAAGPDDAAARAARAVFRRVARIAYRDAVDLHDLAVDGEDLRALGIAPGPALGKILEALLTEVLDEPALNTRERLLSRARVLARGIAPSSPEA